MMVTLKVMTYFKVSLATHNWDRAFFIRQAGQHLAAGPEPRAGSRGQHPAAHIP